MVLMLSEIVKKTCELKTREEKVAWLKQNNSRALQDILIAMYDKKKIKFLIPTPNLHILHHKLMRIKALCSVKHVSSNISFRALVERM